MCHGDTTEVSTILRLLIQKFFICSKEKVLVDFKDWVLSIF